MGIMNLAFPLIALYMGPIALWAYFARGRRMSRKRMSMHMAGMTQGPRDSVWQVSLSDHALGPEFRGRSVRLDGARAVRDLEGADRQLEPLVPDADRNDARLRDQLAGQPLAPQARHQRADADRLEQAHNVRALLVRER